MLKSFNWLGPRALVAAQWIASFSGIYVLGLLGLTLPLLGSRLSLPVLASGVAVAAVYVWGWRMGPAVLAAGTAIDLTLHQPLLGAAGVGLGLASGSIFCTWLLKRWVFDSAFGRAKDVPLFIMAAALGMMLPPTLGMLGFKLSATSLGLPAAVQWARWWANSTSGVILLAPILMGSKGNLLQFAAHWKTGILWLLVVLLCCASILIAPGELGRPIIMLLSVCVVVVGSICFGLPLAALGALAITTCAAVSLAFGLGILGQFHILQGLVTVWAFAGVLAGLNFIITALLAERDAASIGKLRAERRYAQIFEASPHPLWVHDRETRQFLVVNATAIHQYGYSKEEFLSNRVNILGSSAARVLPNLEEHGAAAEGLEAFETRHLTRDGRTLEVELWIRPIELEGRTADLVFAVDVTERRAFGQALVEAVAAEQRRIGQEMHDGLGQELTGLALSLRALSNRALKEGEEIASDLDELARQATNCIADAQQVVQGLSPLAHSDESVDSALEALARRSSMSGVAVTFRSEHSESLALELKVRHHLFRIAQEAVQNALKHSGATKIEIILRARGGDISLCILDDGRNGVPQGKLGLGLGMRTMRFRASAIGAKLSVDTSPGHHAVICDIKRSTTLSQHLADIAS